MKLAMAAALAVMISQSAKAQIYTCTPDIAAGFVFNEQARSWQSTTFTVGPAFRIRRLTDTEKEDKIFGARLDSIWGVFRGDDKYPLGFCPDAENVFGKDLTMRPLPPILICQGACNLTFNRDIRRFIATYYGGYVHGLDNSDDTPVMMAGRCAVNWQR